VSLGPGDVVGGRYRLEKVIGEGGMAIIFDALHLRTDQRRAVKVIRPELVRKHPELAARFVQEARIAARIGESPHIVRVDDADIDVERGVPFMAMELIAGQTLEAALEREPMPPVLVQSLMGQLGEALEQAHTAAVVHRDLKPANLFVLKDRKGSTVLKVADFGIAKLLEQSPARTGTQAGTVEYAAPEQLGLMYAQVAASQGVTIARSVSPATDVWPLALIAYEMLTGHPGGQFWGVSWGEIQLRTVAAPAPRASERAGAAAWRLPRDFDAWCAQCLERDARMRFQSARATMSAFAALFEGQRKTEYQPPVWQSPPVVPQPQRVSATRLADAPPVTGRSETGTLPSAGDSVPSRTSSTGGGAAIPVAPGRRVRRRVPVAALAPIALVGLGLGGASWTLLQGTSASTAPATSSTPQAFSRSPVAPDPMNWTDAKAYCEKHSNAAAEWELPAKDDLTALASGSYLTNKGYYWSSTPGASTNTAWAVTSLGTAYESAVSDLYYARCVHQ
jgi:serine/threonine protein kinase